MAQRLWRTLSEMGVLPEALMNYLALLGWAPSGGDKEIFPKDELIKEFSLERVNASPAVFDTEKLHWLNRHYIKAEQPERIHQLGTEALQRAGLLPPAVNGNVSSWTNSVIDLLTPYVDQFDQLPEKAKIIFKHDAAAAWLCRRMRRFLPATKPRPWRRRLKSVLERITAYSGTL